MSKFLVFIIAVTIGSLAQGDVLTDFDGLGDNKELMDNAQALNPDVRVNVVQERIVKRRNRIELAPEVASIGGGNPYIDTYGYGLNLHYHITPMWSVGVRYTYFTNELNREGENLINDIDANGQGIVPDIDQPLNSTMAFVNFYPIYGKFNFFNMGITHFDIYGTAGYGRIELKNGGTNTWTAGGGVGLWWSQHLTTRLEIRYQNYEANYLRFNTTDSLDTTVASLQFGYML